MASKTITSQEVQVPPRMHSKEFTKRYIIAAICIAFAGIAMGLMTQSLFSIL